MQPITKILMVLVSLFMCASINPVQAADMEDPYTPGITVTSANNWSQGYITLFGGYGNSEWDGPLSYDDHNPNGPLIFNNANQSIEDRNWFGGIGIGVDRQLGRFVGGVIADVAYSNMGETESFLPYPNNPGSPAWEITTDIEAFGTLRARLGFLLNDSLLAYGTAGAAWAMVDSSIEPVYDWGSNGHATSQNNHFGYTVGGGLEWKITENVSMNGEYLYVDLGEQDYRFAGETLGGSTYNTDNFHPDLSLHLIKLGLNYRF